MESPQIFFWIVLSGLLLLTRQGPLRLQLDKKYWIILFALLLVTRVPSMAHYFSIDKVNLAFSLEKFDPRVHQPQPPGYPFFVFFARIVNALFRNPERTFAFISLLVGGISLCAAFALGSRIFSRWAGAAGALLLLVTPPFWYANLEGPLRPNLALFSLLTAYCCWRCWNGEKQFAYWGAIALGVGGGFRPDLVAFLLPLWFISSCAGTRSWRPVLQASALLVAIVLIWMGALVIAMGGAGTFVTVMLDYAVAQSGHGSVIFGSSIIAWLRQINRLVIWNGLAMFSWIWAVPFCVRRPEDAGRTSARAGLISAFFFIWLVPGLIIQAMTHVEEAGHTLFSVAALCVLGGYVLSLVRGREIALLGALLASAVVFLEVGDLFPLPVRTVSDEKRTPSIEDAILFGSYETSIGQIRGFDDMTKTTLQEIEEFTPKNRPSTVISTDSYVDRFFMNWRIGRYYLPDRDFWIFYNDSNPKRVEHIRRDKRLESRETSPLEIPVFREGRILWLIEPGSAFHKEIAANQTLNGGKRVFYSDITPGSPPFIIDGVKIIPMS
jgi:Dolichyl-phosphate-mannose-protein mannosyltransferase